MSLKSIFLTLVCLAATTLGALAQEPAPIVRDIEIQYVGAPTVSRERILANMRSAVGKAYSQQAIDEDIRTLYASGSVDNVRIFGEPLPNGVKVIVVVQTKATVAEVALNGVTKLKTKSLKNDLTVKAGETLNAANLEIDRQKILEEYAKRGFPETTVTYDVQTNDVTGKTRVVYNVAEGGKQVIGDISFQGNASYKARELRKVVKTKPKSLLSFVTKAGRLDQQKLEADVAALREFYQNNGFIDAEVSPDLVPKKGDEVELVFRINEGPRYQTGNVTVSGASVFSNDEIRSKLTLQSGEAFSPAKLRADAKTIQDLYGTRGYVDMGVNGQTTSGGPQTIDVAYVLDEGIQSYVERVNIEGNVRTKDKVIRRELAVAPGDVFDTVRVEASKQRLGNLNYFSRVDTYPSDTLVPGRKDLTVLVEEKRTGSFNFGAGFSSIDSVLGFVEVQQSNFDITNWPNLTGGGQRFRSRLQYGTRRKDFIIGLTEPYFLDYQLAVGGEVFFREASFVSNVYSQRNYGFALNARKALTPFTAVRVEYRLENISIFDLDDGVSQSIRDEEGDRLKSAITSGVTYDTRDSVFLTRRGERVELTGYVGGGPLGGSTDIYGFSIEGTKYFPLPGDTILLFQGEIAGVDTWAGGDRVPIFDRLYLGGANNLRGFRFRDVGPKDDDGEPIGGNSLARFTTEYTFPIVDRVRGAVFYDVGFVNRGAYEFSPDEVNSDVGIGVRLDLPIGPVRIDYGIPVQSGADNDSSGRFNFNIGYQF